MLFLHRREDMERFSALAEEFQLKVIVSEKIDDLFALPALYRTAREALSLMTDERFHGGRVYTVAQLRTPLLLKNLEGREDLIAQEVRTLAARDREKGTQYCETLYYYLICCRSLQKTCDALFTHRNTVLYRIRRMQEEFGIPLDEPGCWSVCAGRRTRLWRRLDCVLYLAKGVRQQPDGICLRVRHGIWRCDDYSDCRSVHGVPQMGL